MEKNKFWLLLVLLTLFAFIPETHAQSRFPGMYLISFTDKNNSPYSIQRPEEFLSERAIERRKIRNGADISPADFPPNPFYIDSLRHYQAQVSFASRWLNAVLVRMDDSLQLEAIKKISFVDSTAYLAPAKPTPKKKKSKRRVKSVNTVAQSIPEHIDYGGSFRQLQLIGLTDLHDQGYLGEGIQIAVLDNGFKGMKKMPVFNSLFDNAQILGTFDVAEPGSDVFQAGTHGTYVMTMMAAFEEGVLVGSAPGASYYLIHTEDNSYEYPIEEFNWCIGAEFADSAGADIITSSLIYSQFDDTTLNHTHEQLGQRKAIVSRAAYTATTKGIVVCNSAGNDAGNDWHTIAFPADEAAVLTVGAVNMEGFYAPFSSTGTGNDLLVKPDVVAVGQKAVSVSITTGKFIGINGTSFSNPTIAGAVAVLMQANPKQPEVFYRRVIRQSASQYKHPDSLLGYGIPNFYLAHLLFQNADIDFLKEDDGFMLFPNPVQAGQAFVVFRLNYPQKVQLSLVDQSGKQVLNQETNAVEGLNTLRIDSLESLAQGVYLLILKTEEASFTEKLLK